jgi:hypothetical protein
MNEKQIEISAAIDVAETTDMLRGTRLTPFKKDRPTLEVPPMTAGRHGHNGVPGANFFPPSPLESGH